jgi:hypothetical protein
MATKIDLKQLTQLFIQSASNEELPMPIRQFAAQCSVLGRHVAIEAQARIALAAKLDGQIAELANHILATRPATPEAPAQAPAPGAEPVAEEQPGEQQEMSEDEEAQAMADKVMRETQAEIEAIANAPAVVTPLRKANGNQKEAS